MECDGLNMLGPMRSDTVRRCDFVGSSSGLVGGSSSCAGGLGGPMFKLHTV